MIQLEKEISKLTESHFPSFYKEDGPLFMLFVNEYFKWLENNYYYITLDDSEGFNIGDVVSQGDQTGVIEAKSGNSILIKCDGNSTFLSKTEKTLYSPITNSTGESSFAVDSYSPSVIYNSRNLVDNRDVDRTVEPFLIYFKEKYLKGIEFTAKTNKRTLVKAATDIFSSKGSERSLDLLFKLVYGQNVEVYYPGDDILKLSDGEWYVPLYLEVTQSTRNKTYVGKVITGSISGATGFVETVITRNVAGRDIDVLYITNTSGNFRTGEVVSDDGTLADAPKITGSLTTIDITSGGERFTVGEIVDIISSEGVQGKALVTAVVAETGIVRFTLVDGGWGFTNNALTLVATKMLGYSNLTNSNTSINSFLDYETVSQNLHSLQLSEVVGNFTTGKRIVNPSGANSIVVSLQHAFNDNDAITIVSTVTGNISSNSYLSVSNSVVISVTGNTEYEINEAIIQSNGTSNTNIGTLINKEPVVILTVNASSISSNGFHIGDYIVQTTTGATGTIAATPRSSLHGFNNVTHIVIRNASENFNNVSSVNAYVSSSNLTFTCSANVTNAAYGTLLELNGTLNDTWVVGNTISGQISNKTGNIQVVTDVGGKLLSTNNVTATGNVIKSNTSYVGVISVNNAFYSAPGTIIRGQTSNSTANLVLVSAGTGANVSIGLIDDIEFAILDITFISSNNQNDVAFPDVKLNGVNSGYGFLSGVRVSNSGSGYDNTNIVIFTGNSTFNAANASIVTNNSGSIVSVFLTSNTGSGYTETPTATIANSSGGSAGIGTGASLIPVFPLGFEKLTQGSVTSDPIYQLINYNKVSVGRIASLGSVDPGENYNVSPFVRFLQPEISSLGIKNVFVTVSNASGNFIVGEDVLQTVNAAGVTVVSNNFTGNASQSYVTGEMVTSTDGVRIVAQGVIKSTNTSGNTHTTLISGTIGTFSNTINVTSLTVSTNTRFIVNDTVTQGSASGTLLSSNTTRLIIKSVTGTFTANSTNVTSSSGGTATISGTSNTKAYTLIGDTSNGVSDISSVTITGAPVIARGRIESISNNVLTVMRKSLVGNIGNTAGSIKGVISGANATVVSTIVDPSSNVSGDNSILLSEVATTNGSLQSIKIIDSGIGYVDGKSVSISSSEGGFGAVGRVNNLNQGISEGYFRTSRGFTSDNKYIHDGEYYQEYSYEIRTGIPLDKYSEMLKNVIHVAGTKFFGQLKTGTLANSQVNVSSSSITIE